jgi:sulfur carrier protein
MNLVINGESRDFSAPLSVAALLETLGYAGKRIAVERNGEIVPKSLHGETALVEGDNSKSSSRLAAVNAESAG